MQNEVLPNVTSVRDLGINVTNYLSPSDHLCDIAAKAHKRASLIHRYFVSRNTDLLIRAYKVYVRQLLEYNSVVWSPSTIHDIETIESAQRRFTENTRISQFFLQVTFTEFKLTKPRTSQAIN